MELQGYQAHCNPGLCTGVWMPRTFFPNLYMAASFSSFGCLLQHPFQRVLLWPSLVFPAVHYSLHMSLTVLTQSELTCLPVLLLSCDMKMTLVFHTCHAGIVKLCHSSTQRLAHHGHTLHKCDCRAPCLVPTLWTLNGQPLVVGRLCLLQGSRGCSVSRM